MREPNAPETSDVEWRNWTGDESCRPKVIVRPRSIEEIATAVSRAAREGLRVHGRRRALLPATLRETSQPLARRWC